MSDAEKTEEPTSKKLQDSHSKGQFAKSQEIGTAAILAASFGIIVFIGSDKAKEVGTFAASIFSHLHDTKLTEENTSSYFSQVFQFMFGILLPLFIATMVAAVTAGGLQSGFKFTPKALDAKLNKMDPIKGFGKIFNKRSLVQFVVDLAKLATVFGILYGLIVKTMNDPIFTSPVDITYLGQFLFRLFTEMLARLLVAIVVIAGIDYIWQRRKTHEEMKMTKQEVKDEMKNQEGNPEIKAQQRRMARQLLQKQMIKAVPTADVVVTNPTHFAVALKYERGKDAAPVVLAKGQGALARRIKALARENGVPMVENKPVARMLYKVGQVGKTIPLELYEVVARILAHVYKTHRYYFHRLPARRLAAKA